MTTKNPETRLIVSLKEDRLSPTSLLHVFKAYFVFVDPEDGKIKNPSGFYAWTDPWQASLADLQVRAQADADPDNTAGFYGFKAEYFEIYSLDRHRAEICVKTLRRAERHMEKVQAQYGYPQDIWAWLGRFAEAFNVSTYGWQTVPGAWDYAGHNFEWGNLDFIRHTVEAHCKSLQGVK